MILLFFREVNKKHHKIINIALSKFLILYQIQFSDCMKKIAFFSFIFLFFNSLAFSQTATSAVVLENQSLKQCIEYALAHSYALSNAQIDIQVAEADIARYRADGLPQISGSAGFQDNFIVPKAFVPAQLVNPNAPEGTFAAVAFQPQYGGNAGINLQQLLFDASYLVALQAAKVGRNVVIKQYQLSKNEVIANVMKAYYTVLINEERMNLLNKNIDRLDQLHKETKAMYENGLVEKIDVDRLAVNLNNLKVEKQKLVRASELSSVLLKYQMGLNLQDKLSTSEKLKDIKYEIPTDLPQYDYNKRIEFNLLGLQKEADILTIKNARMGYFPKLNFGMGFGANSGSNKFADMVNFGERWFMNANYGLSLQVPIFDGFRKSALMQRGKLGLKKTENRIKDFQRTIDLQVGQAIIQLTNGIETLEAQKQNMELASEVYRLAQIKYKEGVGSNLEIVDAENAYKTSETNYYMALYETLIAKVDLEVAKGTLLENFGK